MKAILFLFMTLFSAPAFAAADFSEATTSALKVFEDLRLVAYALAAFGLAAFSTSAIFGKISFKWLVLICGGLFILAYAEELAEYITDTSVEQKSQTPTNPGNSDPNSTASDGSYNGEDFASQIPSLDPFDPEKGSLLEDGRLESPSPFGSLSAKYESAGDPSAIGYDKVGGHSYGKHQIAANTGSMDGYLAYLNKSSDPNHRALAAELEAAGGASAAKAGTDEFKAKWKELSKNEDFNASQQKYLTKTLYDPVERTAEAIPGMNLDQRDPVIKEVLYSTAIQHGPGGAAKVLSRSLGDDVTGMSDEEIIKRIYAERPKYFGSSNAQIQASAANRMKNEQADALKMLQK